VKKRILIVSECFYPEEFKINDLALFWAKKGYIVSVLTLTPTYPYGDIYPGYKNKIFQKDEYSNIQIYRIFSVLGYKKSLIRKILRYLVFMFLGGIISIYLGKKNDLIFGYNLGSLTDMVPVKLISIFYKKRTMLWVQDIWPDSIYAYGIKKTKLRDYVLNIFVKSIYRNIDFLALSSNGFKEKLGQYNQIKAKFLYAPNWPDDINNESKPIKFSLEKKIHFTFAGNLGKMQNLENIIIAFSQLPSSIQKKVQLNIIGDGSHSEFLQDLTNLKNIKFHGKKPRSQMGNVFSASDFLIVSLIDEPIFSLTVPAKVQTYIAAKKPIIGVINGEAKSIIENNNLGITAHPSNIEEIISVFTICSKMTKDQRKSYTLNNDYLIRNIFNKDKVLGNISKAFIDKKK